MNQVVSTENHGTLIAFLQSEYQEDTSLTPLSFYRNTESFLSLSNSSR